MIAALIPFALQAPADADPAGAAAMSMFECLQSFAASPSKAAFVKLEGDLGRAIAADPKMGHMGFGIDDAGGRGCRVSYTGNAAKADKLARPIPGSRRTARSGKRTRRASPAPSAAAARPSAWRFANRRRRMAVQRSRRP